MSTKVITLQMFGCIIGCMVPLVGGIIWINSSITELNTRVETQGAMVHEMKSDLGAITDLKKVQVDVERMRTGYTKQWEIISEIRTELDRRQSVIIRSEREINELDDRVRILERKVQ